VTLINCLQMRPQSGCGPEELSRGRLVMDEGPEGADAVPLNGSGSGGW